jgi:AraC-like DNA-binding protein
MAGNASAINLQSRSSQKALSMQTNNLDSWNTILRQRFGTVHAESRRGTQFCATITSLDVGDIPMVQCASSPACVSHEPILGNSLNMPAFIVKAQLKGSSRLYCDEKQVTLNPGDILICDNSRAYNLDFNCETTIVSVPISEVYIRQFTPFPSDVAFTPVAVENPIGRVAFDYLVSLLRNQTESMSEAAREKLFSTFLELTLLSISDQETCKLSDTSLGTSSSRSLFNRCCGYIDQHLDNDELNPSSIAKTIGISLRHLQSTFAAHGWTVRDYISDHRLQAAKKMLESSVYEARTISEIAYSTGHKSLAHFSRSFKAKFELSPSLLRH